MDLLRRENSETRQVQFSFGRYDQMREPLAPGHCVLESDPNKQASYGKTAWEEQNRIVAIEDRFAAAIGNEAIAVKEIDVQEAWVKGAGNSSIQTEASLSIRQEP